MTVNINTSDISSSTAFLSLGFRPFFLGAGLFALLSMPIWMAAYSFHLNPHINHLSALHWHAHEMIYGYSMAVIAGFLLTAVTNWTGQKTATDYPLLLIFLLWALARLLPFIPVPAGLVMMFVADSLFYIFLLMMELMVQNPIKVMAHRKAHR